MLAALLALAVAACVPTDPEPPAVEEPGAFTVRDVATVVPSAGLPAEAWTQDANNNLDITRHEGRIYLAFRTAPTHFASTETRLHVVSSEDERTWRWEGSFHLDTDLREPRFLSWNGDLLLYFAVLGQNSAAFEPQGMMWARQLSPGSWTEPEFFYGDGFIPWRVRLLDGVPSMLTYVGGEEIYTGEEPEPIHVHWLRSDDGVEWTPWVEGQPIVQVGGGSETDLALQDDGSLVAVVRNEAGDDLGWGSRICRAEASALADWTCVGDPRKYDSPLVFRHGEGTFLIGRRHLSPSGNYDLFQRDLSHADQTRAYQVDYWQHPKRCSLWRVDPVALRVDWILDLDSAGDTCFASEVPEGELDHIIYNYSSEPGEPDPTWLQGQIAPTNILRQTLRLGAP